MIKINRREKKDETSHWDKIKTGKNLCFVCDKKFKLHHRRVYIGKHKRSEEDLFRHEYCESGSRNWFNKFGGRLTFKSDFIKK